MSAGDEELRRRAKTELRKRMRGLRKATPELAIASRSEKIVERLLAMDAVARAASVASFWPIVERHEVDLRALDAALRGRGARVAYPSIDRATNAMSFRFARDPAAMRDAGYGFREPDAAAPAAARGEIDVVVVPALAVDARGYRLGYGAGYYDRTLPLYAPPAVAVAVAFDFQLLVDLPATGGDVPVDWVVTDARALRATR